MFHKPSYEQLKNRFTHHAPFGDQAERYAAVRAAILKAATVCVGVSPCSPEQSRALNALDEAMMLFNAAIARNESTSPPLPERDEGKVVNEDGIDIIG